MTLKDLSEAKAKFDKKSYPSVPDYAVPRTKFSDKTAGGLTTAIKTFCEIYGIFCQRTGSEGRYRPGKQVTDVLGRVKQMKGTWLPGTSVGQGDLTVVFKGVYIAVEVKIGKDRQSEVQKKFEDTLTRSGGNYIIVKSWDDFYMKFRGVCKKIAA